MKNGRFLGNGSKQAKLWNVKDGYATGVITDKNYNVVSEVFYKVKKCIRLETGVPGVRVFAPKFIEKHKGKSCKGRRCPHWGTIMFEHEGVLVCPMHGLKGDINKEIII